MKLSTKGRYATRALLELGLREDSHPVRLKDIAFCQNISIRYLENIFRKLKEAQLVKGIVGLRGGYVLTKSPEAITVLSIVEAVEGDLNIVECVNYPESCSYVSECITHNVWKKLNRVIREELDSITLQSLVDIKRRMQNTVMNW
jgi:Rrf2 family iron-sulfur cluster assembly transcriptional regulator